jgi:predicted DNA-binding protein with PD1-like motif
VIFCRETWYVCGRMPVAFELHRSAKCRHFVVRIGQGESLTGALAAALRDEQVMCGWLRASGVLAEVDLRAFRSEGGSLGPARRIHGPLQVLTLEGGAGLGEQGDPTVSLRALLARETDAGLETLAGEIEGARVIALEAIVTVLEDLALERSVDRAAGVSLFALGASASPAVSANGGAGRGPSPPSPPARSVASAASVAGGGALAASAGHAAWSGALDASYDAARARSGPGSPAPAPGHAPVIGAANTGSMGTQLSNAMPARPARPAIAEVDSPVPETGAIVEHFAFGTCEVVKSEGDRLHLRDLRVGKDGRIREIALEMLRVTRLDDVGGKPHYKLERRI